MVDHIHTQYIYIIYRYKVLSRTPFPSVFVYVNLHAMYLIYPLVKALDWAEMSGNPFTLDIGLQFWLATFSIPNQMLSIL